MRSFRLSSRPAILIVVLLVASLGTSTLLLGSQYQVVLGISLLLNVALAYSWNLISGYTGYLSFGHVAFFGIGAYVVALATATGWPLVLALLAAAALCWLLAIPLGYVMLRLRGPYFALGMLAVAEVCRLVAGEWRGVTGGGSGSFVMLGDQVGTVFVSLLVLVCAALLVTDRIENSRFGLQLLSIREDEEAALSLGIDATRVKLVAFSFSAALPGVVGGLYAAYIGFIDPQSAFALRYTTNMVLMTIVGGAGTVLGPLIGGTVVTASLEPLWARFPQYHLMVSGVGITLAILVLPQGLIDFPKRWGWIPQIRTLVSSVGDRVASSRLGMPTDRGGA